MQQYLSILQKVLNEGITTNNRTGIGTKSIFGTQSKYDLRDGFPLITSKKMFLKGIVVELIRMIRGDTNIKYLVDRGVKIWDERPFQNWLDHSGEISNPQTYPKYSESWIQLKKDFIENIKNKEDSDPRVIKWGDLGPVYGHQWRNFNSQGIDQLAQAVHQIQNNPNDRRIIISARNPAQISSMLLPPCHAFFQFYVNTHDHSLDLQLYQRSADMFLGVPFNIASYATLLLLISNICGLKAGVFTHTLGDTHIYLNHLDQVQEQLSRTPKTLPQLHLKKDIYTLQDIENLEREDFELVGYDPHPKISGSVAV